MRYGDLSACINVCGGRGGSDAATMQVIDIKKHGRCSGPAGEAMRRLNDDESKGSLFRRALAEGAGNADTRAAPGFAAQALSSKFVETWDPWEVWLRHIERPRRLRAGRSD